MIQQEWFALLECTPLQNKLCLSKPKSFSIIQKIRDKPNWHGIPKFLGLSLFGRPSQDIRTLGQESFSEIKEDKKLRNYQDVCLENTIRCLDEWGGATIIADCGSGKTAMALSVFCKLKRRALVLCNRVFLMDQWKNEIESWTTCKKVGWIQSSTVDVDSDISVGSIDSLAQCEYAPEILNSFGLVIIDEMHHLAALSLSTVLPKFKPRYILAISATPDRNDGLEHLLYWLAGPTSFVYKRLPEITGIRNTVEVTQHIFISGEQKVIMYGGGQLGFAKMVSLLAVDCARNKFLLDLCRSKMHRKKILIVTSLVEHARFISVSLEAGLIYGGHGDKESVKNAKCIVSTYQYLEEGYDDPKIDTMVLALPRSKIQQTIGRCERTHEGKLVPEVHDIVDDFSIFKSMSWKRHKFYQSRGFLIKRITFSSN